MINIPVGWLVLGSLAVITIGYIAIGIDVDVTFRRGDFLALSFLIFTCVGTVLALVRGLGSLFPAMVANTLVFQRRGLGGLIVSLVITGLIIALGWGQVENEENPQTLKRNLVAYEILGGLAFALFAYFATDSLSNTLPPKLFPIVAGIIAGFLGILGEIFKFLELKQRQLRKLIGTIAIGGLLIGIIISRLLPPAPTPN
ncbi:MAG: hypothetical protein RMK91_04005 [Pseudanabaenaceae cyanobacterium SKYGB_i_bin29]|nr:hypothetical protein [Pseudanabaenaceae cyanobacterium SKYG29]MDW8421007.1 hypothetical protein [Pseudanabaenaceae cyanobacterium SKYGB_i_bin29]